MIIGTEAHILRLKTLRFRLLVMGLVLKVRPLRQTEYLVITLLVTLISRQGGYLVILSKEAASGLA